MTGKSRSATTTGAVTGSASGETDATLTIYIDGAARGNPGPSGIGVAIYDARGRSLRQFCKYVGETTNNVAEYLALVYALQEALMLHARAVTVCTDSELLSKQLNGEYKVRDEQLRLWYDQVIHLRSAFRTVAVQAVGRERNVAADRLANEAIDQRFDTNVKYR